MANIDPQAAAPAAVAAPLDADAKKAAFDQYNVAVADYQKALPAYREAAVAASIEAIISATGKILADRTAQEKARATKEGRDPDTVTIENFKPEDFATVLANLNSNVKPELITPSGLYKSSAETKAAVQNHAHLSENNLVDRIIANGDLRPVLMEKINELGHSTRDPSKKSAYMNAVRNTNPRLIGADDLPTVKTGFKGEEKTWGELHELYVKLSSPFFTSVVLPAADEEFKGKGLNPPAAPVAPE
ncbi:MAG: hypothetical protein KBE16_02580 [Alphaproteobacteria bacterium]|nr:hypothetical protein [Alphaproteobacteria bacterium]MBP9877272.1 hypothetical protein [Alphaproteobacteria bacterium]